VALKQIPIEEATLPDLRAFAQNVLQIEVPERANKQAVRGKIADAGWTMGHIVLDDASGIDLPGARDRESGLVNVRPRLTEAGEPVLNSDGEPENEIKVLVHTSDKPGGEDPVFVSINGRGMYVPRGQNVWVPEKFVGALKAAEEKHYPEYDGGDGGLGKPRLVQSYPFSYV
jgi:hypothetical protein